jgi:hypothetical protein
MDETAAGAPPPGEESGEPVSHAVRGPGAGSRLPAEGGGKDLIERDSEVAGLPGRFDGADLTPEDIGEA